MSDNNCFDTYIQPQYASLQSIKKDKQTEFSKELFIFLQQYPEFSNDPSTLNVLRYCFDHYVNYDPASRDLPLPDKLRRAGEMAINFMGGFMGAKVDHRPE